MMHSASPAWSLRLPRRFACLGLYLWACLVPAWPAVLDGPLASRVLAPVPACLPARPPQSMPGSLPHFLPCPLPCPLQCGATATSWTPPAGSPSGWSGTQHFTSSQRCALCCRCRCCRRRRCLLPAAPGVCSSCCGRALARVAQAPRFTQPACPSASFPWLQDTPKGRLLLKDDARGAIDGTIFHK